MIYQNVGHFFIPYFIGVCGKSVPPILGQTRRPAEAEANDYAALKEAAISE